MPTPDPLRAAEDELAKLRRWIAEVAGFIHDPAHDLAARTALARRLGLHKPRPQ